MFFLHDIITWPSKIISICTSPCYFLKKFMGIATMHSSCTFSHQTDLMKIHMSSYQFRILWTHKPWLIIFKNFKILIKVYLGQTFKNPNFGDQSKLERLDHAITNFLKTPLWCINLFLFLETKKPSSHNWALLMHASFSYQILSHQALQKHTPNHHNDPSSTFTPLWSSCTVAATLSHCPLVFGRRR
jgi:hypothetical protein